MTTLDLAQIVIRRGTASQWSIADPILASGEFGLETDTKLVKIGDGTSLWSVLTYQGPQLAAQINSATAKTTPVGADTFPLSDSAASNGLKKVSWTNILATAKAYFDTLYATISNLALKAPLASPTFTGTVTLPSGTALTSPLVTGLALNDASIVFEGATADAFETTLTVTDPTADRTITLPNASGTVALTSDITATAFVGCSIYKSASQTLTKGSQVIITFNSENYDTDSLHDTSSNTSRITIPTGKGGKWLFNWTLGVQSSDQIFTSLYKNGSALTLGTIGNTFSGVQNTGGYSVRSLSGSVVLSLAAGDYIEFSVNISGSGSADVEATIFSASWLGA